MKKSLKQWIKLIKKFWVKEMGWTYHALESYQVRFCTIEIFSKIQDGMKIEIEISQSSKLASSVDDADIEFEVKIFAGKIVYDFSELLQKSAEFLNENYKKQFLDFVKNQKGEK